ncbi:MAG: MaoC family dehydratase N-terminal domain-containing protein [Archangium sp.]|nr:MaoC family dehydratase N-terminal domain-containing protein [Archangium sp.]
MALNPAFIGRTYGPFIYEVGAEKLREFAYAVGGTVPSVGFMSQGAPKGQLPILNDRDFGAKSEHGSIIAMPNFAVVFSITPFGKACADPELGINMLYLVHGEQSFEWFEVIKPGDVMTTTGVITAITTKNDKDFLTVDTESRNQRGAMVVKGTWTAVIRHG